MDRLPTCDACEPEWCVLADGNLPRAAKIVYWKLRLGQDSTVMCKQSPRWGILYMVPGTESTWVESKFNFEEKKLEHFLFLLSRCGVLMFQTYVASNLTSLPVNCISFNVATRQSRQGFESWAARARSKTDSPTNCIESGTRLLFAPTHICPKPRLGRFKIQVAQDYIQSRSKNGRSGLEK